MTMFSCDLVDMHAQVALESHNTEALAPSTRNIPYTTLGAFCASFTVRWLRWPWVALAMFLYGIP